MRSLLPVQLQAIRQKEMNDMAKHAENMNAERKSARFRADFIRLAGIGPELAEFLTELIKSPKFSFQYLPKDAAKLKTRWTQFYLRFR